MPINIDLSNFFRQDVESRINLELATQEGGKFHTALNECMQEIRNAAISSGQNPSMAEKSGAALIFRENFMEFVKNAYDAKRDGVIPQMTVSAVINPQKKLEIQISDNGSPFPMSYQDGRYAATVRSTKLQPGKQSADEEVTGGANLGLRDAQEVCSRNGGDLVIYTGRGDEAKSVNLISDIPSNQNEVNEVYTISQLHAERAQQSHSPTLGGDKIELGGLTLGASKLSKRRAMNAGVLPNLTSEQVQQPSQKGSRAQSPHGVTLPEIPSGRDKQSAVERKSDISPVPHRKPSAPYLPPVGESALGSRDATKEDFSSSNHSLRGGTPPADAPHKPSRTSTKPVSLPKLDLPSSKKSEEVDDKDPHTKQTPKRR